MSEEEEVAAEPMTPVLDVEDLRFDIFRAGVYEVRITHLPTGHVATSTHASLLRAREQALAELGRKVERNLNQRGVGSGSAAST